jgi:hypothetical protein
MTFLLLASAHGPEFVQNHLQGLSNRLKCLGLLSFLNIDGHNGISGCGRSVPSTYPSRAGVMSPVGLHPHIGSYEHQGNRPKAVKGAAEQSALERRGRSP